MQRYNVRLLIAYDGSEFLGWQKTGKGTGRTVEETVERVLEKILQHPVNLQAASRTDRGVHAKGQVVNFFTSHTFDMAKLQRKMNQLLPPDVVVRSAVEAAPDFHPTLHAKGKEYHYEIACTPSCLPHVRFTRWHIPHPLDLDLMQEASSFIVGTRDFLAFCNARKNLCYENTIRTLAALRLIQVEDGLRIELIGDHFLYKMARNIVGTLVYVGLRKISPSQIPYIVAGKKRTEAGITAPAHGLTLYQVYYGDTTQRHEGGA